MAPHNPNARSALSAALARAAVDHRFRQALLHSPHAAIFDAFQIRIPSDYRIRFIEKGADVDELIVLSDVVASDGALSESDLESVAGGGDTTFEWKWEPPPQ